MLKLNGFQPVEVLQVFQPGVGDLGMAETQNSKLRQVFQFGKTCIQNLGARQVQLFQAGKVGQGF